MNLTVNYLDFCVKHCSNKTLISYSDIKATDSDGKAITIDKQSKIKLNSYKVVDDKINLNIKIGNCNFLSIFDWSEEIPFTHLDSGQIAYKQVNFTKVPLGENLENYIFSRSPKFAVKYAINITGKRLSPFLEEKIFKNYRYVTDYCVYFDVDLSEEQEIIFLKDPSGEFVANYALQKIKGRLPETLHNFLIMKFADSTKYRSYWIKKYFESIK